MTALQETRRDLALRDAGEKGVIRLRMMTGETK
jgi:hypothetical protein